MTYGEVKSRMSAAEFTRWLAFYSYESKMEAEARRKAKAKGR